MSEKTHTEQIMLRDQARMRREALMHRVLYILRDTIQVRPLEPSVDVERVRVDMTDESARVLAPLLEAVDILESIIFASDQCVGHKHCGHSMEPWQRARDLLAGKWKADCDHDIEWPSRALPVAAPSGERGEREG